MLKKAILLFFLTILTAGNSFAEKGDKEKFTTKKIDVTITDENGLNYFLVFNKIKTPGTPGGKYSVEFWVNDEVQIRAPEVWSLLFRTEEENFGGRVSGSEDRYGSAGVLYFDIAEEDLKALAGLKGIRVRMMMKGEELGNFPFKDYTVASEAALKKAIDTILKY